MAARSCFLCLLLPAAAVFLGLLSPTYAADSNILYSGDCLYPGQYISYGRYWLIMQGDCNFVLYDDGRAIWASGTHGRASYCFVKMQSDGNLVVYDGSGRPLWASNTNRGAGNYVLVLQRDRNVVVYGGSIWATASNAYGASVAVDGGLAAGRNETSPLGSVDVVVSANRGGDAHLGRKIDMVTTHEPERA